MNQMVTFMNLLRNFMYKSQIVKVCAIIFRLYIAEKVCEFCGVCSARCFGFQSFNSCHCRVWSFHLHHRLYHPKQTNTSVKGCSI